MGARITLLSVSLLLLTIACRLPGATPATCAPRQDDPQGYLYQICTYVQDKQIDVSPADPTRYGIKRIEDGVYNDRPAVWVFLDCCYLGDIAIFDKESGQIVDFRVGDQ